MEGKVVFDGGGGLDRLDLEGSADVCQGARTEREALGVMSLPTLVFGAEVKSSRVLQVGR